MSYLLIILVVLGAFGIFISVATSAYQRRMAKHRGVPREEFISRFANVGIPSEVPATVYDYYKSQIRSKEFGLAPDDDYQRVFSEGDEDIDDDGLLLMKALRLKLPADYNPMRLDVPMVKTIRDMVLWLEWVRQHQSG